jgi:TrmH family RNA methyltransferase
MAVTLTSEKNPLLKQIRRAASKGSLTGDGFALAEGPRLVEEAVRSHAEIGAVIAVESAAAPVGEDRVVRVSERAFAALASTDAPQGVLALVRPPVWTTEDLLRGTPLVVILDRIQDPGNAGSILRAAEAFGASGAIFLKGSVNPYNPKAMRASAGSVFRMPLLSGVNEDALPDLPLWAAHPRSMLALDAANLAAPCGLIIGAEGAGVSPALLRRASAVRIPTTGVESLNAAAAATVLLYEARRQRGAR